MTSTSIFNPGDRVRRLYAPDTGGTVRSLHSFDRVALVEFDNGTVVTVDTTNLEFAPAKDNRPAYVKEIDLDKRRALARLKALEGGIADLRRYLTSSKFGALRQVNPADVLLRLDEANWAASDAEAQVER